MRKISLIVIHCSATRADRDFTAKDVDTAHRFRGFPFASNPPSKHTPKLIEL